jgi:hypothetical protein
MPVSLACRCCSLRSSSSCRLMTSRRVAGVLETYCTHSCPSSVHSLSSHDLAVSSRKPGSNRPPACSCARRRRLPAVCHACGARADGGPGALRAEGRRVAVLPGWEDGVQDVLGLADGGGRLRGVALLVLRRGDQDGVVIPHERVDRRDHGEAACSSPHSTLNRWPSVWHVASCVPQIQFTNITIPSASVHSSCRPQTISRGFSRSTWQIATRSLTYPQLNNAANQALRKNSTNWATHSPAPSMLGALLLLCLQATLLEGFSVPASAPSRPAVFARSQCALAPRGTAAGLPEQEEASWAQFVAELQSLEDARARCDRNPPSPADCGPLARFLPGRRVEVTIDHPMAGREVLYASVRGFFPFQSTGTPPWLRYAFVETRRPIAAPAGCDGCLASIAYIYIYLSLSLYRHTHTHTSSSDF